MENTHSDDYQPKVEASLNLAPLIADGRGCLVCHDVEGIERVMLREIEIYYGGAPWQEITRKSDDIFSLVERGIVRWPALNRIRSASFDVRLADSKTPHKVRICPGETLIPQDGVWQIITRWLLARRFMGGAA